MEYIISLTIVAIAGFIAHFLYRRTRIRAELEAKKHLNDVMVREFNSCMINTKCPCFKEYISIPYHPMKPKEFKCPKCGLDSAYEVKMTTFKRTEPLKVGNTDNA